MGTPIGQGGMHALDVVMQKIRFLVLKFIAHRELIARKVVAADDAESGTTSVSC